MQEFADRSERDPAPETLSLVEGFGLASQDQQAQQSQVLLRLERLGAGDSLELQSAQEPLDLQHALQSLWPGQWDWAVLEAGPAQWRVRITRRAVASACCGCCSGAR